MEKLEGYKTIIASVLVMVLGGTVDPALISEYINLIFIGIGALFAVLRWVTDGPVGDKIKALLGQ